MKTKLLSFLNSVFFLFLLGSAGNHVSAMPNPLGCIPAAMPVLGSTATTICSGASVTLSVTVGLLNGNGNWVWHDGSCTGTVVGSGTSIVVNPTSNSIYFARGEGGCGTPGPCGSISIGIHQVTPAVSIGSNSPVCVGSQLNLTSTGGTSATWSGPNGFTSMQHDTSIVSATAAATGTYTMTATDGSGCYDSSSTVSVLVSMSTTTHVDTAICQGGAAFIHGAWRTSAGIFYDSLLTVSSCDSVVITTLSIHPVYAYTPTAHICNGDSLFLGGAYRKTPGVYNDNYLSVLGCDSTYTTTLIVNPIYSFTDTVSICSGDSIHLGGAWQHAPGIYTDTFPSASACDSIWIRTLVVHSVTAVHLGVDTTITPGSTLILEAGTHYESYLWSTGQTFHSIVVNATGTYSVAVIDSNGCHSFDAIHVNVGTGIHEVQGISDFRVYPVPTTGSVSLELYSEREEKAVFTIHDVLGREFVNRTVELKPGKNLFTEDMSAQANGIYFVTLKGNFGVVTEKVVEQK